MEQTAKVGVLGERNMRWYLGGQLLSLTGSMLQAAVLSLLVLSTAKSNAPLWVGVVWACDFGPGLVLAPLAGILLDRYNKRKVLMLTAMGGVLQTALLAFLTFTNQITIPEICFLALYMGIVNAIDGPGRNVIIKDAVVHDYNVRPAAKMFSSLYNLAQIFGPGLAGFLILSFGYPLTFVLNGFSFVALIVVLSNMRLAAAPTQESTAKSIRQQLTEGARYILSEPGLKTSILLTSAVCAFGQFYSPLLAVIAHQLFRGNPVTYSYLAASAGAGSFMGAVLLVSLNEKLSHRRLVTGGMLCMGAALIALSHVSVLQIGMPLLGLIGFCFMISFSSLRSSILHIAKREYAGIVMGYTFTFFFGGIVVGALWSGLVANLFGSSSALVLGGSLLMLVGLTTPFLAGVRAID